MAVLDGYVWLVWVGAIMSFGFGYATGSNDVANAFGTSVGSKTLTMKQAIIIAAIFEFGGALLLGRVSTDVIAGGIADPAAFSRDPEFYAYGMVIALFVGTVWQLIASYLGVNVSATHSIIGAIMGFALVYGGKDAVLWAKKEPGAIPPYKGVVPIICSWFVSPILTACASALIFLICRTFVLRRKNAWQLALWVLPIAVFFTTMINVYFVFTKGAKKTLTKDGKQWSDSKSAWISAAVAAGLAIISAILAHTVLRSALIKKFSEEGQAAEKEAAAKTAVDVEAAAGKKETFLSKLGHQAVKGVTYDIHQVVEEDPIVNAIHANAEKFDPRAEFAFSYLQVFSAICVIFAHGAGEVGYMAGPLASIYNIYKNGSLYTKTSAGKYVTKVQPEIWTILLGAFALVIGLATYGYKVTQTMGTVLSKLTPSRGFAAELATALVILLASQYRLPTSSSQCITGGIVGVGLCEGAKGVNWKVFALQFASWMATLFAVGGVTAAIYAVGIYSPSKLSTKDVDKYEDAMINTTRTFYSNFNKTLLAYKDASNKSAIPTLPIGTWMKLNKTINAEDKKVKSLLDFKIQGAFDPQKAIDGLNQALFLIQNYSVFTLGQTTVFPSALVCNNNITADILLGTKAACPAPPIIPKGAKFNATLFS